MQNVTLRAYFEGDPTAACLAGTDGSIRECNPAFVELFGFADGGQARESRLTELLKDPAAWCRAAESAAAGTPTTRLEIEGRSRDGRALLLSAALRSAGDPDLPGTVLAWFADQTDLTQVPRSPTGARLVRAIGHDLGNMMMVIRGFAEVLARELPEGGRGRGWIAQIRTASDRAATLGEELLTTARPPEPGLEDLAPGAMLDACRALVQRTAGPGVEVDLRAPEGARSLRTNRDQLEAVIQSLVSLARLDRPKDTKLRVEASWSDAVPSALVVRVCGADQARAWEARFPPSPPPG